MSHGINVKESIEDKHSWFNIKRFDIGGVSFDGPQKSIDIKNIDAKRFAIVSSRFTAKFAESSKKIHKFSELEELYEESDSKSIGSRFSQYTWLGSIPRVLNYTLFFNPVRYMDKEEALTTFLDYYYTYSSLFLTVPSIRQRKWVKDTGEEEIVADIEDTKQSVDFFYDTLSKRNRKPIFVPISIRMSARDIDSLVDHYVKKERFCYWIDFDGKAINSETLGRLRHLFRRVEDKGYFDETVTYFTNVKREIISNTKKERSEASDVLCSVAGANLIGCNREPNRMFDPKPPAAPPEHKARVLDSDTYYYVKSKDAGMLSPAMYVTQNYINLKEEFKNQTDFFLSKGNIERLISSKEMLVKYKDGEVLRGILARRDEPIPSDVKDFY